MPPRKLSIPPPYSLKSPTASHARTSRFHPVLWIAVATSIGLFFLLTRPHSFSSYTPATVIPDGTPSVVIVTVMDFAFSAAYRRMIKENRRRYAAHHRYATFFPNVADYNLTEPASPKSWAKLPAIRHAMTLHPFTAYFWYIDLNAMIMNVSIQVEDHIMETSRLESIMLVDHPVIPPNNIIRTPAQRKGAHIDMVITQDRDGLSPGSFILRRGEWAKYLLDSWFDPLFRSYEFQKQERHAMEHLVQWHSTILTRLALVPQRILNSYTKGEDAELYQDGDFVANFIGCEEDSARNCDEEALSLFQRFESAS